MTGTVIQDKTEHDERVPTPLGPGSARLTVSALGGADYPQGVVQADGTTGTPLGAFHVAGPVTCVLVMGNEVSIKYRFDTATGAAATAMLQGGGVEVFIQATGSPNTANRSIRTRSARP